MSVPAQGTTFGLGLQTAKVGHGGTYDPTTDPAAWYKFRTPRSSAVPVQSQQVFPPELGGLLTPAGAYKDMAFFGGDVDLIPRLEDNIGHILKAAFGAATVTADEDTEGVTNVGVSSHKFAFAADGFTLPWLAVRESIPKETGYMGVHGFDCRLANLRLTIPAYGKVFARATFQGRDFKLDDGETGWVWDNAAFEDFSTTPDSGNGWLKIDGVSYTNVVGVTLDLSNGLTRPQDEMAVGSPNPEGFTPLQRVATVRMVFRWKDSDLYKQLYTGAVDGTTFSFLPFIKETGANKAFEMKFLAPKEIAGAASTCNYGIHVVGNAVTFAADPIELRGGSIISQVITGTFLTPASGDYLEMHVQNDRAAAY